MKSASRRGMRDVATLQGLVHQSTPATRPQAVSRFAHLESERARLTREIQTWTARQTAALRALAAVDEELVSLRQFLLEHPPADAGEDIPFRPGDRPDGGRIASDPNTWRGGGARRGARTPREETAAPMRGGLTIEY
jgi:hypothetical protein